MIYIYREGWWWCGCSHDQNDAYVGAQLYTETRSTRDDALHFHYGTYNYIYCGKRARLWVKRTQSFSCAIISHIQSHCYIYICLYMLHLRCAICLYIELTRKHIYIYEPQWWRDTLYRGTSAQCMREIVPLTCDGIAEAERAMTPTKTVACDVIGCDPQIARRAPSLLRSGGGGWLVGWHTHTQV